MGKQRMLGGITSLMFLLVLFCGKTTAYAAEVSELERRINALSEEIDSLKSGSSDAKHGDRIHLHGYFDFEYNRPTFRSANTTVPNQFDSGATKFDMHRFVLGTEVRLADWIIFNGEIDFEHSAQAMEFELGQVDFMIDPMINFRGGIVLMPIGMLNEYHEPVNYWTVQRPMLQTAVIPTSWSGAGGGIFGGLADGLKYRLYVVKSLQSVRPGNFDSGEGNGNGGSSCAFNANTGIANDPCQFNNALGASVAATGRLEYSKLYPGLQLGFSFYTGNSTQNLMPQGGRVSLVEGDVKYRLKWFDANASVVNTTIADAAALNSYAITQGTNNGVIPKQIFGWNIQGGIHLPQLLNINTRHDVVPFALYESYNLNKQVPTGFQANPALDTKVRTFGVAYFPVPEVALKIDFQTFTRGDNSRQEQVNMGLAFVY